MESSLKSAHVGEEEEEEEEGRGGGRVVSISVTDRAGGMEQGTLDNALGALTQGRTLFPYSPYSPFSPFSPYSPYSFYSPYSPYSPYCFLLPP